MRLVAWVLIKHLAAAGCLNFDDTVIENRRAATGALVVEHNRDFVLPTATAYVAAHICAIAPILAGVWASCVPIPEFNTLVTQPACF